MTTPEGNDPTYRNDSIAKHREEFNLISPSEYGAFSSSLGDYYEALSELFKSDKYDSLQDLVSRLNSIRLEISKSVDKISISLLVEVPSHIVIAMLTSLTHEINNTYLQFIDDIGTIQCDLCIDTRIDTDTFHEEAYDILSSNDIDDFLDYPAKIASLFSSQIDKMNKHILMHATQNM